MTILSLLLTCLLALHVRGSILIDDFQHVERYLNEENGLNDLTGTTGNVAINSVAGGVLSLRVNNARATWFSDLRCNSISSSFSALQIDVKSTKSGAPITLQLALGTSAGSPFSCNTYALYNVTINTSTTMSTYTVPIPDFKAPSGLPLRSFHLVNLSTGVTYTVDNIKLVGGSFVGPCTGYNNGCIAVNSLPKYLPATGLYPLYVSAWTDVSRELHVDLMHNGTVYGSSKKKISPAVDNAYMYIEMPLFYRPLDNSIDDNLSFDIYWITPPPAVTNIKLVNNDLAYSTKLTACSPGKFALTYDDGPASYTSGLLDLLKSEGVHATFFVNGNATSFYDGTPVGGAIFPDIVKRMQAEGHLVGSHTWSHATLTTLTNAQIDSEMHQVEGMLAGLGVPKPTLMRPPHSATNSRVDQELQKLGYTDVSLNIDSWDWYLLGDVNTSYSIYLDRLGKASPATDGFISIQHMVQPYVVDLTKRIIDLVRSKGYQFVTADACLNGGGL